MGHLVWTAQHAGVRWGRAGGLREAWAMDVASSTELPSFQGEAHKSVVGPVGAEPSLA